MVRLLQVPEFTARATWDNTVTMAVLNEIAINISLIEVVSLLISGWFRCGKLRHLLASDEDSTRGGRMRGDARLRMASVMHARLVLESA